MINRLGLALACVAAMVLPACGGGSTAAPAFSGGIASNPAANTMPIVVDRGPSQLADAGLSTINTPFVTVTLCTPGSTTACQTIDHVALDTGSIGLRVMASVLGPGVSLPAVDDPASGRALRECAQFADGYSWGSVVTADVQLGGAALSSLPLHLIGDAAAGTAPSSCVSGPDESTVLAFGANGVLGIGNFVQDCGDACAASAIAGTYYACDTGGGASCQSTATDLGRQVSNPVALMSTDNNGVVIVLSAVPTSGALSTAGTLTFGVGTEGNNAVGVARFYTLDDAGTLVTVFGGLAQSGSFIDSGSNGLYFSDPSLAVCGDAAAFYCPAQTLAMTAVIQGLNGNSAAIDFTVSNADQIFATPDAAVAGLAGPNAAASGGSFGGFDWGLPFFYGRPVYVLFEKQASNGVTGPALAF